MKTILKAIIMTVVLQASVANALTGNILKDLPEDYVNGYITGIKEAFDSDGFFCIPAEATLGQVIAIAHQYFNGYPEQLHKNAGELVISALAAAFPCPKTKTSTKPLTRGDLNNFAYDIYLGEIVKSEIHRGKICPQKGHKLDLNEMISFAHERLAYQVVDLGNEPLSDRTSKSIETDLEIKFYCYK